jgi:glycosyltransferase involved in cell wall biosynthesis
MRIILSNASFKWGGVHRITELLAAGFERRGHDVLILCRPKSALEDRLRGRFSLVAIARGMDFSPWAVARIAGRLRSFRPQVVLALMDKDLRLTGPAARLLGIPVVARRANDQPIGSGWYTRLIYGRIATQVIANSDATRDTLLASAPWLKQQHVSVIHNGVDIDEIRNATPAFLPLSKDSVIVGFAGRLETRKGVLDLLDAWPAIAQAQPHAYLVLAGRGPLEAQVAERARQLDRALFLGYRDDVASLLQRCHIVAMPSHWEGFGLVAAEALAAGKPVVATQTSSLPEIVRDGQEGLLVPVRQPRALTAALQRLIADPQLRAQLGANGQQRALACFSHERMIAQYEALLTRVAHSAGPADRH